MKDCKKIYIFPCSSDYAKELFSFQSDKRVKSNIHFKKNKKFNFLRKLHFSKILNLPYKEIWYRKFLQDLNVKQENENFFIFFDGNYLFNNIVFLNYLKKKYPKGKLILWYWNILAERKVKNRIELETIYDKIVTFDLGDAKKFKYIYYPQIYKNNELQGQEKKVIKSDAFFIGQDKGRVVILDKLIKKLDRYNLNLDISLIKEKDKNYTNYKNISKYLVEDYIKYESVLKKISETNVVLDIVQINQTGLTLRALESIFFSKKMITNNIEIKKYDFYNPENIIIIEDIEDIKIDIEFFKKKYIPLNESIIQKYTPEKWLEFLTN